MSTADPHASSPLLSAGPDPASAAATLILLHGRGSSGQDILSLYPEVAPPTFAALAPQAVGHTWYPHSFLAPIPSNQPYLDSALTKIESIVISLLTQKIPPNKIALLGFSQGACLACEFAARHPRPYGALIAFTGALIGPPGTPRDYPGSLSGVPVLLATSDPDPHVPFARVRETQSVFQKMGATVELRRYPNMPHTINADELTAARALLAKLT